MQSPEVFLNQLEITLTDFLDSTRVIASPVDSKLRSFVNLEAFYFATTKSKKKFDDNPLEYCNRLTDPVTHQQFKPGALSPSVEFENRVMFFLTDSTKTEFLADTKKYWPPEYSMRGM